MAVRYNWRRVQLPSDSRKSGCCFTGERATAFDEVKHCFQAPSLLDFRKSVSEPAETAHDEDKGREFALAARLFGNNKSKDHYNLCFCVVLCLFPYGVLTFRFTNVYISRFGVCVYMVVLTQRLRRSDVRRMGFVGLLTYTSKRVFVSYCLS